MFGLFRLSFFVLILSGTALVGCGSAQLSADSVARVGDKVVSEADLKPYSEANLAASSRQLTAAGQWVSSRPVSPDFKDCLAFKKTIIATTPRATEMISDEEDNMLAGADNAQGSFLNACKGDLANIKKQSVQQLLSAAWVEQIADELAVTVSAEEVAASREEQLKQITSQSGKSEKELFERAQVSEATINMSITNQIRYEKVYQKLSAASDEEMRQYYDKNKDSAFPDVSYKEARATIAASLAGNTPSELAATKLRLATECADGYRVLMCGNASSENGSPITLVLMPSLAAMLYPETRSAVVSISGPSGGVVGDDPTSYADGGAIYKDVPNFRPETEEELEKIIKKYTSPTANPEADN